MGKKELWMYGGNPNHAGRGTMKGLLSNTIIFRDIQDKPSTTAVGFLHRQYVGEISNPKMPGDPGSK